MSGHKSNVTLSGSQEVPALNVPGSGTGTISVARDKSVSGSVTTTGVAGTAAHIHQAAAGQNRPVAIPLISPQREAGGSRSDLGNDDLNFHDRLKQCWTRLAATFFESH